MSIVVFLNKRLKMKNNKRIKRIAIIGYFADGKESFDGQTVSTRLLRDELNKQEFNKEVLSVDTYQYRKRFAVILFHYIKAMFTCSHIIVMLSGNGLRFFCPLIYYTNKLFKHKVFHRVIGGELDAFLTRNPKCIHYINSFQVNWVQSETLVKRLSDMGITNSKYLENFRNITSVKLPDIIPMYKKPYRFCTFCRVSKAKGIGVAVKAIATVNQQLGAGTAQLDIYGPIEQEYKDEFNTLLRQYEGFVNYCGSIPSSEAVSILKDYYMHLFPSTWSGEGFPGTLIDCYNAALPTIASTWAYNTEYVREGELGYLYDWQNEKLLSEQIIRAINDQQSVVQMKRLCLKEAEKYKSETIMAKIVAEMTR